MSAAIAACGRDTSAAHPCTPGTNQVCTCSSGSLGTQACNPDESRDECLCAPESDAGVGVDATSVVDLGSSPVDLGVSDASPIDMSASPDLGVPPSTSSRLVAGSTFTCFRKVAGDIVCWGANASGDLETASMSAAANGFVLTGLTNPMQLSAGTNYICGIRSGGQVACWGENSAGELGDGTTTDRNAATNLFGITDAIHVDTSLVLSRLGPPYDGNHTCIVRSDGSVWCTGLNSHGQVGDGTTTVRLSATEVSGFTDAVQVAAGHAHTCALHASGGVDCWGANDVMQLGSIGADRAAPGPVPDVANAVEIGAGVNYSCARIADGTVKCWGSGASHVLGRCYGGRDAPLAASAQLVEGLSDAVQLSVGGQSACALRADGHVVCWGWNGLGQHGDGTSTAACGTHEVIAVGDAVEIASGSNHNCALRATGDIVCWGGNGTAQLGRMSSDTNPHPSPELVVIPHG